MSRPRSRRTRLPAAGAPLAAAALAAAVLAALPGCGRSERRDNGPALSFEELGDTTGLSRGRPLLTTLDPHRLAGGSLRVRGRLDFPDGTRLQVTVTDVRTGRVAARLQVTVEDGGFETPPFMGERGPLPEAEYRFELLAHFNEAWQPPQVLEATDQGRRLRGPGITRSAMGQPTFMLQEERRL